MTARPFCVAGGWSSTRDAEHGYLDVSSLARDGQQYIGTTFDAAERVLVCGADDLGELPDQTRMFVFPGHEHLTGVLTVGELLRHSGIDEVCGLLGGTPLADDPLDTQDFVRPLLQRGRLVLTVRPSRDGLVPFEQPHPTPCCADHR